MRKADAEINARLYILNKFCPIYGNMCKSQCVFFRQAQVTYDDDTVAQGKIKEEDAYGVRSGYCKINTFVEKTIKKFST